MPVVKIGSITFIVNGYTLNNSVPYFQKAVPSALRSRIGKSNIKIRLWDKDGNFAIQCLRLNEKYSALFRAMKTDPLLTPSENKMAAIALLATFGLEVGDGLREVQMGHGVQGTKDPKAHLSQFEDAILHQFEHPNALTKAAFGALYNKLPVLLSEAFIVYLDNHPKGKSRDFQANQGQHWSKLVALLGDIALEGLSRDNARQYRDHRLAAGVKTTTLSREISVLRAVVNVACREIPLNVKNPFDSLPIANVNEDAVKRHPFTRDEWASLIKAAILANDEPRRIGRSIYGRETCRNHRA